MSRTYTIYALSTALSPISHMAKTEGNEAVINRERIVTPNGIRFIPALSGNALRHKLIRSPGARFLVDRWGLNGALSMSQLNFLFHGGSLTESTNRQDTAAVVEMHRLFPLLRLLGGSVPAAILPGSLIVNRGVLVCRENTGRLATMLPWQLPAGLRPAEDFVDGYQYTRSDARKSVSDLVRDDPGDSSNLMIFNGQSVIPGAIFAHGFVLQNVSELEVGALLLSLALWRDSGATIGGQSARGHGQLNTVVNVSPPVDCSALIGAYGAHVDAVKADGIAWLTKAFEPKTDKPKRGRSNAAA